MKESNQVITFGCRLNIYESEIIRDNLANSGLKDVAIFNSCAVTKEAEKQARQAIRKLKKNDPQKKIIVTGCAAQNTPKMFLDMPEVDKVIGNEEKLKTDYYNFDSPISVGDIMKVKKTSHCNIPHKVHGKSRAFLQVQNGCNHRCTFCIIPFGRGNSRSVPIGQIVSQIRNFLENGYKEVVLTGIDMTAYGQDLPGSPTFAQMIRRLLALIPDLPRLRLSSIDVAEIDEDLFDLMANHNRLMPHFHISLQSGDNMILKRMKRRHNREQVIEFCHSLRKIRKNVSFGADIIAGFPTETDEMFENSRNLIIEAGIQYLHVFPYSERDGTPAARMPQVKHAIRKDRASILRETGNKELQKFFQKNINEEVELLLETNNVGHSENFIPVKFTDEILSGTIIKARLTDFNGEFMNAQIIQRQ